MRQPKEPTRKITINAENNVDADGKWSWSVHIYGVDKFDSLDECFDERNRASEHVGMKGYPRHNESSGTCFLQPGGKNVAREKGRKAS